MHNDFIKYNLQTNSKHAETYFIAKTRVILALQCSLVYTFERAPPDNCIAKKQPFKIDI